MGGLLGSIRMSGAQLRRRMAQRSRFINSIETCTALAVPTESSVARIAAVGASIVMAPQEMAPWAQGRAISLVYDLLGLAAEAAKGVSADDERTSRGIATGLTSGSVAALLAMADGVAGASILEAEGELDGALEEGEAVEGQARATQGDVVSFLQQLAADVDRGLVAGEAATSIPGDAVGVHLQKTAVVPGEVPEGALLESASASFGFTLPPGAAAAFEALDVGAGASGCEGLGAGFSGNCVGAARDAGSLDVSLVSVYTAFDTHDNATLSPDATANATNSTAAAAAPSVPVSDVTSITVVAGGAEVPLQNLSEPILFSLPLTSRGLARHQKGAAPGVEAGAGAPLLAAACSWWDEAREAYSTEGCFPMPNPHPPGAVLEWARGFELPLYGGVTNHSDFYRSWTIEHEWLFDGCTAELDEDGFRVFAGPECNATWPGNALGCWWEVDSQAFNGTGCVQGAVQHCACTHLTDFKITLEVPRARITVATAEEMRLSADEVWRIKELLGITALMCAVGAILAAGAQWTIVRGRRKFIDLIKEPRFGFLEVGGVWTWPFHQLVGSRVDPNLGEVPVISGPGMALSAALSMRYNRTRAALPFELLHAMVETGQVVSVDEETFWKGFARRTRTSGIYEQILKVRGIGSAPSLAAGPAVLLPQLVSLV